ncbi:MAG: S-ribosylhomocysteine lyase [Alistipes sp.]|nr:S-ribosylhomocysteine lyase [Alistipes sp.]
MKSVVSSFDVDHRTLREGLYLRSTYKINDELSVLSWDLRFCAPMDKRPLSAGAVHTIEHLMAYWLRMDGKIGKSIVSFCPMGCLTGFYLSTMNDVTADDIKAAFGEVARKVFPIKGKEDIVGMTEIQCGNPALFDIEGANKAVADYYKVLFG